MKYYIVSIIVLLLSGCANMMLGGSEDCSLPTARPSLECSCYQADSIWRCSRRINYERWR